MPCYAPPTPPDERVRIRRFGRLRSTSQPRQPQPVEVGGRQREVKSGVVGGPPPAARVGRGFLGDDRGDTPKS